MMIVLEIFTKISLIQKHRININDTILEKDGLSSKRQLKTLFLLRQEQQHHSFNHQTDDVANLKYIDSFFRTVIES